MTSTNYSIPLDGTTVAIGPFPFPVRSVTPVNKCAAGNLIVVDDKGTQYTATPETADTYQAEDTVRLQCRIDAAQSSGALQVIVSDQEPQNPVNNAQLASLASGSSGAVLIPVVALASFPPANPSDGQTVYLALPASFDPVGGKVIRWLCVYDAALAAWHVSGPALYAEVTTSETCTSAGYVDLPTVGPGINLPRPGDYEITVGASMGVSVSVGGQGGAMAYSGAGIVSPADADAASTGTGNVAGSFPASGTRTRPKNGLLATSSIVAKYRMLTANGVTFANRYMLAAPMRIT